MTSRQELYNILKSLLKLLYQEKEALLHSDGFKVAEIVEKKNEVIEKLSQIREATATPAEADESQPNVIPTNAAVNCTPELVPTEYTKVGRSQSDVIPTKVAVNCTPEPIPTEFTKVGGSPLLKLINEINTLQETNLLLTQQSLSYQNALLESIAKNLQNMSNTYSSKGGYQKSNNIGLIDQKV